MAKAKKESGLVFAIALLVIMVVAVVVTIVTAYSEPVPTEVTTVETSETTPETEAYKEIRIALFETSNLHGYIMDTAGGDKNDFQYRLAFIANVFNNARTSGDYDDVMLLDAGDMYQGSPISNLSEGAAVRAAYDYMGYDAVAAGNHEFDWDFTKYGADVSATVPAYEFGSYSGDPDIPVLSANIYNVTNHRRSLLTKDYVIIEKAGVRIAVIGYTPDYSSEIRSSKIEEFEFHGDITEFAARVKEINEAEQPAVTVVLAHEAADAVAEAMDPADVDLVAGLHSESKESGLASNGIPYVQSASEAEGYGRATLIVGSDGSVAVENPVSVSIMDNTDLLYDTLSNASNLDPEIKALSLAAWDSISEQMKEALGYIDSSVEKDGVISGKTTTGGNFITGIMLESTRDEGVVAAFYNAGGFRKDLVVQQDGIYQVSVGDIYALCPFNNRWMIYDLSGEELAQQIVNGLINGDYGDQVSGLKFEYNNNGTEEAPEYEIVSITLDNGTKVDITGTEAKYRVVVTDFSASIEGSVFEGKEPLHSELDAPVDNEAIIDYLRGRKENSDLHIPTDTNPRGVCLNAGT